MDARGVTNIGGFGGKFPSTRWSMIVAAREDSGKALEELCQLYWKPVYLRMRATSSLGNEELKDLTQEFFMEVIEGKVLEHFSEERGSFRGYIKGALQRFQLEHHRKKGALKRGGGKNIINLDNKIVEKNPPAASGESNPEEVFDRQWARSVVETATEDLEKELAGSGKETHFGVFDRYVLNRPVDQDPTYADVAREFGLPEEEISKILVHCRDRMRKLTVRHIQDYVVDEKDVAMEYAEILRLLR